MKRFTKINRLSFLFIAVLLSVGLTAGPAFSKTTRWRMGTTWTPSIALIEADKHFCQTVDELSGGEFKIKLHSAGELVPAFELFDAVAKGTLEAGGEWPNYWTGKNSAFDLLGSYPMGLTPVDYMVWIYQGGGLELYQEVYGKFGIYYLPHAVTPMESGVRGHKPIKSLADYNGLKIRMSGQTQGKMLKELGAAQTMLSGGEIYQALDKGVIDAAEFSSPVIDWGMGFGEVTKYWATPGWHQPASLLGVMINKKVWDELPDQQKTMLKHAAMSNMLWSFTWMEYTSIDATKKFLEKGTEITRLSDEDLAKIQTMVEKYLVESSKENPLFAKVAYSQMKFLQDIAQWRSIATPFTYGRNPAAFPDMDALKAEAEKAGK
jgi:TRAP-type mannitol/chloroaromatic compound transport system substrate-binding protein